MCKQVCPHLFPLDQWFWSIYLQEQSCAIIPLCMFVCAHVHVLSVNFVCLVVPFTISIFFCPQTHASLRGACLFMPFCFFFSPLYALAGMQMFSIYDCICVRSRAEWLQQSQVLPRELVRAVAVLFVFHCCSNNGSPRAGSPPNWETTERVRRGESDRVAFTPARLHTHQHSHLLFLQSRAEHAG